jgi:hypothetical protein
MLDDMIEEAAPRIFTDDEIKPQSTNSMPNPVALLNMAWQQFEADRAGYKLWERNAISSFLGRH